jgi:hypothetical protein
MDSGEEQGWRQLATLGHKLGLKSGSASREPFLQVCGSGCFLRWESTCHALLKNPHLGTDQDAFWHIS